MPCLLTHRAALHRPRGSVGSMLSAPEPRRAEAPAQTGPFVCVGGCRRVVASRCPGRTPFQALILVLTTVRKRELLDLVLAPGELEMRGW